MAQLLDEAVRVRQLVRKYWLLSESQLRSAERVARDAGLSLLEVLADGELLDGEALAFLKGELTPTSGAAPAPDACKDPAATLDEITAAYNAGQLLLYQLVQRLRACELGLLHCSGCQCQVPELPGEKQHHRCPRCQMTLTPIHRRGLAGSLDLPLPAPARLEIRHVPASPGVLEDTLSDQAQDLIERISHSKTRKTIKPSPDELVEVVPQTNHTPSSTRLQRMESLQQQGLKRIGLLVGAGLLLILVVVGWVAFRGRQPVTRPDNPTEATGDPPVGKRVKVYGRAMTDTIMMEPKPAHFLLALDLDRHFWVRCPGPEAEEQLRRLSRYIGSLDRGAQVYVEVLGKFSRNSHGTDNTPSGPQKLHVVALRLRRVNRLPGARIQE